MNAQKLSDQLASQGFQSLKVTEPNCLMHGMIVLSKKVHVQVPLLYSQPNIVLEVANGSFKFYQSRAEFSHVVNDIEDALAEEASQ